MLAKIKQKIKNGHQNLKERRQLLNLIPTDFDKPRLIWLAHETICHQRGPIWKIVMGLCLLAILVFSYFYKDWSFALAILVFAGVYYLVNRKQPRKIEIILSDAGIKVGNRKFPYGQIKAFWIIYQPPYFSTLNLKVADQFISEIVIQLEDQSPGAVRDLLITKIPELERASQSLSDLFLRIFKI